MPNISESLGIVNLKDEVAVALSQDVEYRIYEIIQEAAKFMRHSRRTKLHTEDIDYALRVRNVEPLYGHGALGDTVFRKVDTLAEEIYIVDDEELDFDKILNIPLPPAPRDVTYTAHWLAVEGVQPAIRQNPAPIPVETEEPALLNGKRARTESIPPSITGPSNTVTAGGDNSASAAASSGPGGVKPLVKHVLSKELQLYYERVTEALLAEDDMLRSTALESLTVDPGIHQLVPYFTQFVAHQVTKHLRHLPVLHTMLLAVRALLDNSRVFMEPYLHQVMPALLTCLVGKRLGSATDSLETPTAVKVENDTAMDEDGPTHSTTTTSGPGASFDHWNLRQLAATLVARICNNYGQAYHTLQHRVTRTLLRAFLDPTKPFPTHYGAIAGLTQLGEPVVRLLILPNIKAYTALLTKAERTAAATAAKSTVSPAGITATTGSHHGDVNTARPADTAAETERCWTALVDALQLLVPTVAGKDDPVGIEQDVLAAAAVSNATNSRTDNPNGVTTESEEKLGTISDATARQLAQAFGEPFAKRLIARHAAWPAIPVALAAIQAGPHVK